MRDAVRVRLSYTIHLDTCITVTGLGNMHTQQPAKLAFFE